MWTDSMVYLNKGNAIVLRIVGFVVVVAFIRLYMTTTHVQDDISRLASQLLKVSKTAQTKVKVDTLAPCGEVCSYNGTLATDKPSDPYPQLTRNIDCNNIMRRMAYRHHSIIRPPPKNVPRRLLDAYTQNGKVKIGKPWYFDEESSKPPFKTIFNKTDINVLVEKVLKHVNINTYRDRNCVMDILKKYSKQIANRKGVVIGTQHPWLESMLLANGARHVTTLEYHTLVYNLPELSFFDPYSYAEMYLRGETKPFEVLATFSSLEHSGLGRYGDPMNPYGDLEAMAQAWCMLKPGATAIVGVRGHSKGGSSIQWNAHRNYGPDRLQYLTANFNVVEAKNCPDFHVILVLTKS